MAEKTVAQLQEEAQLRDRELQESKDQLSAVTSERDTYLEENTSLREAKGAPNPEFEATKAKLEEKVKEKERAAAEAISAAESTKLELEQTKIQLTKERVLRSFPDVLPEWITETTEDSMKVQAQKFVDHMKRKAPAAPPAPPAPPAPGPILPAPGNPPTAAGSAMAGLGGPGVLPTAGPGELDEARKRLVTAQANNDLEGIALSKMQINRLNGGRVEIERNG